MNHDRVHAREPSHRVDRWSVGVIESIGERDGHAVLTVRPVGSGGEGEGGGATGGDDSPIELVVTVAVRDLVVERLPIDDDESAVGQRVWYRKRGG
ncbi:hypothetical protein ACFQMF_11220 [Halorubrum rutilum]|uniref:Uncharacterized protein n=1 Tax=Halorubrum rutilum TaxID=1364933 RepID=A0ABD6ALV1_9EURY|nr:hypothetical protein [Halorubrum rutilum]